MGFKIKLMRNFNFITVLKSTRCRGFQLNGKIVAFAILILALIICSEQAYGQTTIVNYNFNSGSSFATLSSNAVSGITCTATGSSFNNTAAGAISGSNAFTANTTAGNALSAGKSTN